MALKDVLPRLRRARTGLGAAREEALHHLPGGEPLGDGRTTPGIDMTELIARELDVPIMVHSSILSPRHGKPCHRSGASPLIKIPGVA